MKKNMTLTKTLISPLFILLVGVYFLLTNSVNVKAAADGPAMFYPMYSGYNNLGSSSKISNLMQVLDLAYGGNNYIVVRVYPAGLSGYNNALRYDIWVSQYELYFGLNSNVYSFNVTSGGTYSFYRYSYIDFYGDGSDVDETSDREIYSDSNHLSSLYDSNYDYYSNYVVMINSVSSDNPALFPIGYTGEAGVTDPGDLDSDDFYDGQDPNEKVINLPTKPSYTFTPPTQPTFDPSDVLKSLYDFVVWLGTLIKDYFQSVLSFLFNWFVYFGDLIKYGFAKVVSNLQNLIKTFYNNLNSLFAPLLTDIKDLLSTIAGNDSSSLITFLENHFSGFATIRQIYSAFYQIGLYNNEFSVSYFLQHLIVPSWYEFSNCITSHDNFHIISIGYTGWQKFLSTFNTITSVEQAHVFHVPSCSFHGHEIGDFEIDFSWYQPYKIYGDTMISAFLVFFYFYWFITSLSGHLRGYTSIAGDFAKVGDKL